MFIEKIDYQEDFIQYIGIQSDVGERTKKLNGLWVQNTYKLPEKYSDVKEITKVYIESSILEKECVPTISGTNKEGKQFFGHIQAFLGQIHLKIEYIGEDSENHLSILPISQYFTSFVATEEATNVIDVKSYTTKCVVSKIERKKVIYGVYIVLCGD